jgi:hypothetical protein
VKKSDTIFIKLPAQKIQNIYNWYLEADKDIVRVDPESTQCEDKVLRILHIVCIQFPRCGLSRLDRYLASLLVGVPVVLMMGFSGLEPHGHSCSAMSPGMEYFLSSS